MSVWGINYAQDEPTHESWRRVAAEDLDSYKQRYLQEFRVWPVEITELINNSQIMMKIGLYDRPELQPDQWYHERCVIIGDAAHPGT